MIAVLLTGLSVTGKKGRRERQVKKTRAKSACDIFSIYPSGEKKEKRELKGRDLSVKAANI